MAAFTRASCQFCGRCCTVRTDLDEQAEPCVFFSFLALIELSVDVTTFQITSGPLTAFSADRMEMC